MNGSEDTLTAADVIDGGEGTDRLNITLDANGSTVATTALSNIEQFYFRDVADGTTVDFATIAGEEQAWNNLSIGAMTLDNLETGTTVGIKGNGTQDVAATDFSMATAADAISVLVDGGVLGGEDVTNTSDGPTDATLTSSGGENTIGAVQLSAGSTVETATLDAKTDLTSGNVTGFAADSTLTVTGSGAADIGTMETELDTVDASEHTGGLTLTLDDESDTSLTAGSGDDVITTGTAYVADDEASIDAGEGTDRLVVPTGAHITAEAGEKYSNFEELQVVDDQAVDVSDLATNNDISAIFLEADDGNTVGATELTAAQAQNVSIIDGGSAAGGDVTIGVADATTAGQDDTVGVTLDNDDGDIDVDNIVIDGVETLDVTVNTDTESVISALDHQDFDTLNIDGAGDLDLTTATGAANQNTTIDGSEATGDLTLDLQESTTNGMAIQGGSGDDVINGGVGDDVITGNGGDDTFVIADVAADIGSDTITDFTAGGSGDVISSLDVASGDTDGDNFDYSEEAIDGADVTATADDLEVVTDGSGSGNTADSLSDADVEAFLADVDGDGNGLIGNTTAADDFFVAVSDGTDTGIFLVDQDGGDNAVEAAELNLVLTLQGIADPTELAAGDFTT